MMKKAAFLICLIAGVWSVDSGYQELTDLKVYKSGKWSSLVPGTSTVQEVVNVLGVGESSQYVDSLLCYAGTDKFKLYIYFNGKSDDMKSLIKSMDFIPESRVDMSKTIWPNTFKATSVKAVDAAWDEYTDGSGLVYEVYTTKTQYGGRVPGDLNRISFRKPLKVNR